MRVVVTSGGTRETIDSVRFITNLSTGKTGALIAETLARVGHDVSYLHAEGAAMPSGLDRMDARSFRTYDDLANLTRELLAEPEPVQLVIQAAAISDFQVVTPTPGGKLSSTDELTLVLKPRGKILAKLKSWSRHPLSVLAFKLTDTADLSTRREKLESLAEIGADWIVHNDLSQRSGDEARGFTIYATHPEVRETAICADAADLASWIATNLKLVTGEQT